MSRLRKLDEDIMKNNIETRIALLEQSIGHINETLLRMEKKIDGKFDKMEERFDSIDSRIVKIEDRLWSNFIWQLSTMFGLAFTGLGILAKGFHWL